MSNTGNQAAAAKSSSAGASPGQDLPSRDSQGRDSQGRNSLRKDSPGNEAWKRDPSSALLFIVVALVPLVLLVIGIAAVFAWLMMR